MKPNRMEPHHPLSVSLHHLDLPLSTATQFLSFSGTRQRGRRARSSDSRVEEGVSLKPLSKEQERWITGRMVEQEILGSRESGIYSTSSGEEEEREEGRGGVGGEEAAKLRKRSIKMGLLWQHRSDIHCLTYITMLDVWHLVVLNNTLQKISNQNGRSQTEKNI